MNRQGILDSSEPECGHEGYIAEKHVYCPDCGDAGAEMLLQARIAELEAENARLREASERLLSALLPGKVVHMGHEHVRYSATYSIAGWNPVLELQALLGGGG